MGDRREKFRGTSGTTGLFEEFGAGTGEQDEFKRKEREDREEARVVVLGVYIVWVWLF